MNTVETIRLILSVICSAIGLFCIVSAVVGVFRFRTALSRVHAAAIIDTAGALFMLLGVMIGLGFTLTTLKLAVIIGFLWCTSPIASHMVARLEVVSNDELEKTMTIEDPDMVKVEKGGQ